MILRGGEYNTINILWRKYAMNLKNYLLSIATISMLGFSGCGSSGDQNQDASVSLGGSFGSGYAYYKAPWYKNIIPKAYATGFGQIEKAVVIPIVNGEAILEEMKDVTINSDGSFSVNLNKALMFDGESYEANWIILVEKNDGTINFLSIPNNTNDDSLVNFPISQATSSSISLGSVANSNDEAQANITLTDLSEKVTYNINELNQLATMDDVLKSIVNRYKNNKGKSEDEIINETLHVVSTGTYANLTNDYEKASDFAGYAFHFHGGKNSLLATKFQNICDTNGT
jgi:hypothetical protein